MSNQQKGWKCFNPDTIHLGPTKRRKYTTPCDLCAVSKVKCDSTTIPCLRCKRQNRQCTFDRKKKPKVPVREAPQTDVSSVNGNDASPTTTKDFEEFIPPSFEPLYSLRLESPAKLNPCFGKQDLLPFLQIYQKWYYGNWPIVPIVHLIGRLKRLDPDTEAQATVDNILCYSLACSISAAIAKHLTFLKSENPINYTSPLKCEDIADEGLRVRNLINFRMLPCTDNVLISFFYYLYYVNDKDGRSCGLMYMKEAINFTQVLKLHDPSVYRSKTAQEVHLISKFYYMLLISERYMCIEQNLPVCLEYSIPLPVLDYDENPPFLLGFLELLKSFALPDRTFFDNLVNYYSNKSNEGDVILAKHWTPNSSWIRKIQDNLNEIKILYASGETQSVNVILSKHWMRCLVWNMSFQNKLLIINSPDDNCLSFNYPLLIARDFLRETKDLSNFAFESNGPGVSVKLLELAHCVTESINNSYNLECLPILQTLFNMVTRFKSDVTIPQNIYLKVQDIIIMKSSPFNDTGLKFGDDLFDFQIPSVVASPSILNIPKTLVEIDFLSDLSGSPKSIEYNRDS